MDVGPDTRAKRYIKSPESVSRGRSSKRFVQVLLESNLKES